ncbi:MAG TPA: hypothetical protein VNN18_10850 [Candidatus Xenobia bacterium]|nr:hypothetical protein [Candidatus Xenobia bacterium]
MYRWQPFWFFFLAAIAVDAAAQKETPAAAGRVCLELFCESDRVPGEQFAARLLLLPRRPQPQPQYTYPFEKYHGRFHKDALHPWVVTPIISYRDQDSVFFKQWGSGRKGFDLIQFGAGRFGFGPETQRVLITEGDRRSSMPFGSENCAASGFQYTTACQSASYREGDRRYGVAFRIYFGRR